MYTMAEDGIGGVIILAARDGSGIYAKRIAADGAFVDWGASGNTSTATGITVGATATATNASAVAVYAGAHTRITSAEQTANNWSPSNPVLNDTVDLSTASIADGDIIMDETQSLRYHPYQNRSDVQLYAWSIFSKNCLRQYFLHRR